MAISAGIPEQGSIQVGHLELPFVLLQDAQNGISIMLGRAVDKERFAQIEIFVVDSGQMHVRITAAGEEKALFVGLIGNVIHPNMGRVTKDTTILEG